jgi:5-methylcytosine-specific restriction protein A
MSPRRAPVQCSRCGTLHAAGQRCPTCASRAQSRPDATARGYRARGWRARRASFLAEHQQCVLCGATATVADHWPHSRKQLLASGVEDPDAIEYLRPLCRACHGRETAKHQPGGWNRP